MFKRSPSLTEQIKLHIKQQILNGEFEGDRIPSEPELANDLGVSRTTVRDALSRLESEGTIVRKQGMGTFINRPGLQIRSRLEEIWSYENVLKAHGYTPSVHVLGTEKKTAGPKIAKDLGIDENDTVLVIEKLFVEDSTPVILTCNTLPASSIVKPYDEAACSLPIYEFLEEHCQQRLSYYLTDIAPVSASPEVAKKLETPEKTALLALKEVGYDINNQPILKAASYFRDDLIRFRLIRRRT
jgi:GntR family transcriptional regulator